MKAFVYTPSDDAREISFRGVVFPRGVAVPVADQGLADKLSVLPYFRVQPPPKDVAPAAPVDEAGPAKARVPEIVETIRTARDRRRGG